MKVIISLFRRHSTTIMISLLSALLVVVFQIVLTTLQFSKNPSNDQGISIESGEGKLVMGGTGYKPEVLSSIIPDDEIRQFLETGQYKDISVPPNTNRLNLGLDRLIVPLVSRTDSASREPDRQTETHLTMSNWRDYSPRLCESKQGSTASCTMYLVSKSGQVEEVHIILARDMVGGKALISLELPQTAGDSSALFAETPLELHIRPI